MHLLRGCHRLAGSDLLWSVLSVCMARADSQRHSLYQHSKLPNFCGFPHDVPFLRFHSPTVVDWLLSQSKFYVKRIISALIKLHTYGTNLVFIYLSGVMHSNCKQFWCGVTRSKNLTLFFWKSSHSFPWYFRVELSLQSSHIGHPHLLQRGPLLVPSTGAQHSKQTALVLGFGPTTKGSSSNTIDPAFNVSLATTQRPTKSFSWTLITFFTSKTIFNYSDYYRIIQECGFCNTYKHEWRLTRWSKYFVEDRRIKKSIFVSCALCWWSLRMLSFQAATEYRKYSTSHL